MTVLVIDKYTLPNLPYGGLRTIYDFLIALAYRSGAEKIYLFSSDEQENGLCTIAAQFYFSPKDGLADDALFPLVMFRTEKTSRHAHHVWTLVNTLTDANESEERVLESVVSNGLEAIKHLKSYPFDDVAHECVALYEGKINALLEVNMTFE